MRFRRHKYGAKKVTVDGVTFASKAEARRYQELKLMEKAGAIGLLVIQPKFPIEINGKKICTAIMDFRYVENNGSGIIHVEDVKGYDNPLSRLKRKLVEASYGIKVTILK